MTPTNSKISTLEEFEAVDLGTDSLCSLMSHWGQSRRFGRDPGTSGLPPNSGHRQAAPEFLKGATSGHAIFDAAYHLFVTSSIMICIERNFCRYLSVAI